MMENSQTFDLDSHISTFPLLRRFFLTYFKPYLLQIFIATLFIFLVATSSVLQTKLIQPAIDEAFSKKDLVDLMKLFWLALIILGITLVRSFSGYFQSIILGNIGNKIIRHLQTDILQKLLHLDMPFFEKHGSAAQLSRFTNDVFIVKNAFTELAPNTISNSLTLIGFIILIFTLDWQLALGSLIVIPIIIFVVQIIGKTIRRYTNEQQKIMAQSLKDLDDSLKGISQVLLFQSQEQEFKKNTSNFYNFYKIAKKTLIVSAINKPFNQIIIGLLLAFFLLAGGYQLMNHQTTIGTFSAFIAALFNFNTPMRRITNDWINIQQGLSGCQNIFWLLDYKNVVYDSPKAKILRLDKYPKISFHHVCYSYTQKPPLILKDIHYTFSPNTTHAVVGVSGSGKSTLLKLIARFYDPTSGFIQINSQNIAYVTQKSLHHAISVVPQDYWLYNLSIKDNISYGFPNASSYDLDHAIHVAHLNEFISTLPNKINTIVGEAGHNLSGGQRQRIAIARAILTKSPILLLDEATSSLDAQSEKSINQAIQTLSNKTIIIVAHRLSSIMLAQNILLLQNGKLIDSGTHALLYKNNALYKNIIDLQKF